MGEDEDGMSEAGIGAELFVHFHGGLCVVWGLFACIAGLMRGVDVLGAFRLRCGRWRDVGMVYTGAFCDHLLECAIPTAR
jgi:hypothetical protein